MKRFLPALLIGLFIIQFATAQELNYSTLDVNLIEELEKNASSEYDIYVILEDKVDIKSLDKQLKAQRANSSLRARTVMTALQNKAKSSQANLIEELELNKGVKKNSINPFWLANIVFFRADKNVIAKLSNDNRIEFIGIDGQLQLVESEDESMAVVVPDGKERGLSRINVEPMWDLGYTGYGRLALVADTGIDPTHRSFGHRYRGNTNGDSEAWYSWMNQAETPFQCGDHGTHVLGTVLGLDRLNRDTIGVAFDAQWMGSANLCGGGTSSNVGTFQWSVNPDNDMDTMDDMADVINNSWWDPSVFGEDCNSVYVDVLEALEAIGVVVVFSAGNAGPEPETITSPHNINIDIVNTFTVAALNGNDNSLPIAEFSSRGPSSCGGEGSLGIKPEIAAPGVSVRSAVLENEYGFKSGTSMAAPHVAGAVLLLRQAFPEIGSRELKLALYYTCVDLGEPGEDNVFGQGIIDVFAAYNYLIDQGYKPVPPPSSENDLMAYDLITDRFECDQSLSGEFVFFNNSPDTLYSMDLTLSIDGDVQEGVSNEWVGSLPPYTIDTISLEVNSVEVGEHEVVLNISNPNGNNDERVLNNMITKTVTISANERLKTVDLEEQITCEGANMLVKADYEGEGRIQWFDELIGGNLIGEGSQFVVEADESKVIYGDIARDRFVGKIPAASDGIFTTNQQETGLIMNVNYPMRITAFDFYSEQNGNIFIGVENGRGDQIESEIVNSDGSGWQTAEVSIRLPEGFGYRMLYKDGIASLGSASINLEFPYEIENIVSITGSTDPGNYYYFFNLQVEYLDLCGRVPVKVSAVETDSLPVAEFNPNISLININQNQSVEFFNTSINAESYFWDFDDGNTSTEESPSHIYTSTGIFYPSLLITNADGCNDAFVQRIEVSQSTSTKSLVGYENNFIIAPNPFSTRINLSTESPINVERIEVFNSAGVLLNTIKLHNKIDFHTVNMSDLIPGLYYVLIHTDQGIDSHKVVKQ